MRKKSIALVLAMMIGSWVNRVRADIAYGWGNDYDGEVGNAVPYCIVPTSVRGLTSGVTAVAAGEWHSLAVQDSALYMWGYPGLDGNPAQNRNKDLLSATPVSGLGSGVTAIGSGDNFCMVVQNGGIYSWGSGSYGQLGNGSYTSSTVPVAASGMTSNVTAIAGGADHALAIKNGAVFAWGYGVQGQLGAGSLIISNVPVPVNGLGSGVTAIAAGEYHSLAIKNGAVYAWGVNWDGELGTGNTTGSNVPLPVAGLSAGVTGIAAGQAHSLAVQGGLVYAWGWNNGGQLGNGTTADSSIPVLVPGLTDIVAVAANSFNSYALAADGSVWDWGYNGHNELGDGTSIQHLSPEHIAPPLGYRFTSIAAGADGLHVLATVAAVPEPSSMGMLGLGVVSLFSFDRSFRGSLKVPTRERLSRGRGRW